ncbi:hypothetical protein OWM54_16385 [Myxococcus sp. MISCRS1]|uniref:hypothetical protein n=1 Tax=Myxococcus sp. MISCRS1 TaxID=2996786 RepID=UPI00226D81C6|nr:hypothetical protein [Myxococcus sp. MISCRS1]MCY0998718.1 hypothetical protein [Myxococcus sp. MISCRS1]BDT31288.1 hypothetical protein MFMH1_09570 [Myxococcus sp. MH1]
MRQVVIPKNELSEFDLPRVCVITGQTEGITFQPVKFSWYPRWLLIFVPFAALIVLLVAMLLTKRAQGTLPFSEEGWAQWKRAKLVFGLSFLGTIAVLCGAIFAFAGNTQTGSYLMVGVLVAVLIPVVAYSAVVQGKVPQVVRIDNREVTLRLPSDEAASAILRHLQAGQASRAMPAREVRSA